MATAVRLAIRREAAAGRIDTALTVLAERYDITVDEDALAGTGRDADMAQTRQIEAFADLLEQLVAATVPEEIPPTATPLVIDGVELKHIEALAAAGLTTLDDLRAATDDDLLGVHGIGPVTLERIRAHLSELDQS